MFTYQHKFCNIEIPSALQKKKRTETRFTFKCTHQRTGAKTRFVLNLPAHVDLRELAPVFEWLIDRWLRETGNG